MLAYFDRFTEVFPTPFGVALFVFMIVWSSKFFLSNLAKDELRLWLWGEYESNWCRLFCRFFDTIFGENHFSLKTFVRSGVATALIFCVCLIFAVNAVEGFADDVVRYGRVGSLSIVTLSYSVFIFTVINLVPDYFSLWSSRLILGKICGQKPLAVRRISIYVALDFIISFLIGVLTIPFAVSIWISLDGYEYYNDPFSIQVIINDAIGLAIEWFKWVVGFRDDRVESILYVYGYFLLMTVALVTSMFTSLLFWLFAVTTCVMRCFSGTPLCVILAINREPTTQLALVLGAVAFFLVTTAFCFEAFTRFFMSI